MPRSVPGSVGEGSPRGATEIVAPVERRGLRARVRAYRAGIEERPTARRAWRLGVGVLGTLVVAGGIIAIPYPGPGWAIVFVGLAILASEFAWAQHALHYVKGKYDAWSAWLRRQHWSVQLLGLAATGLLVLASLWLFNVFGLVAGWVGLDHWTWLRSPVWG